MFSAYEEGPIKLVIDGEHVITFDRKKKEITIIYEGISKIGYTVWERPATFKEEEQKPKDGTTVL